MGHSKTSNYPTHTLIFFMEGHKQSYECKPNANVEARHLSKKTIIRSDGSTSDKW